MKMKMLILGGPLDCRIVEWVGGDTYRVGPYVPKIGVYIYDRYRVTISKLYGLCALYAGRF